MHSQFILLATAFTSVLAIPQASDNGGKALGAECNPAALQNECAGGASCYATNSMLIPRCGNFQASCTSDAQCAFNLCNEGFCNGLKPTGTGTATSTPAGPSGPSGPKPTGTNLPLGAPCDPDLPNACAGGANCYATNFMLIPSCGNFQASCTSDAQCAFNTCNNGLCNGFKSTASSSYSNTSSSTTSSQSSASSPTTTPPPNNDHTTVRFANTTTTPNTVPPTVYTTAVIVVDGRTSSILVNGAGATTPFGPAASLQPSGAAGLRVGGVVGAAVAAAVGFAMLL